MKKYIRAFLMCISMFTVIPCPFSKWDEEARPLMTLFLPLTGAVIGALWTLTAYILRILSLPPLVCGVILCAFPVIITGGIHMDGFLDTVDAVRSRRDLEGRRRIMKDPHVGSFAVISCVLLIAAQFALFASAKENAKLLTLVFIPVVSRCTAALCVTLLRPMSASEYSGAYRSGIKTSHIVFLSVITAAALSLGFLLLGRYGFAPLAAAAGYLLFLLRAFRSLDGMSGDISGYALTFGELCAVAVYALI